MYQGEQNCDEEPPTSLASLSSATRHDELIGLQTKASFMCAICTRVQICTPGANLHPGCIFGHVNGVLRICSRVQIWVQIVHMNAKCIILNNFIGDFDLWQAFSITILFKTGIKMNLKPFLSK